MFTTMKILHAALLSLFIAAAFAPVNAQRDGTKNIMAPIFSRIYPLEIICFAVEKYEDGAAVLIVLCSQTATTVVWPGNPIYQRNPTGVFIFIDATNGRMFCLDARDAQPAGGGWLGLTIYTCNNSPQQRFTFYGVGSIPVLEGAIGITDSNPARCVDLKNSIRDNGTQVGTYPCTKGSQYERQNQIFSFLTSNYDLNNPH